MSDEPKKRSRKWIAWAVIAVLVLYPLSVGPATVLFLRSGPDSAVATVYSWLYWPLDAFRSVTLNQAIDTYNGWWIRLLGV
jgi:hypothetical protein